jgi:centromere protein X
VIGSALQIVCGLDFQATLSLQRIATPDDAPRFLTATIKTLLETSLAASDDGYKVRVSPTLAELVGEYLRCMVVDATERAKAAARDARMIDESHFDRVLPQLLLDIA